MKLRIQGNSLRLRLTRSEVAELRDAGRVESRLEFAPGHSLAYSVESSPLAASVTANFDGHAIRVTVPATLMRTPILSDRTMDSPNIPANPRTKAARRPRKNELTKCLYRSISLLGTSRY